MTPPTSPATPPPDLPPDPGPPVRAEPPAASALPEVSVLAEATALPEVTALPEAGGVELLRRVVATARDHGGWDGGGRDEGGQDRAHRGADASPADHPDAGTRTTGARQGFAVLRRTPRAGGLPGAGRDPADVVEVLVGDVVDVERLADVPRGGTVLAAVPYRQVRELDREHHDDGAPLRCLVVRERASLSSAAALALLPDDGPVLTEAGFDVSDEEYADVVRRVVVEEIGRGEGANFVVRRDHRSHLDAPPALAALVLLRRLLAGEVGAAWTFAVHLPAPHRGAGRADGADGRADGADGGADGAVTLVGASPERHVSVGPEGVRMNPISGTYRFPAGGPTADGVRAFLADPKEADELAMVVDEELKMMSSACARGGRVVGPHLQQMGHLAHTAYLLEGTSDLDVREVLRRTMFAPTVTGSPVHNAARVVARHERTGRGYYSGVLALIEGGGHGGQSRGASDRDDPSNSGDASDVGDVTRITDSRDGGAAATGSATPHVGGPDETGVVSSVVGVSGSGGSGGGVNSVVSSSGSETLDAPILIRTARLFDDLAPGTDATPGGGSRVVVSVGATIVRHSTPDGEVAETRAKAAGVLAALRGPGTAPVPPDGAPRRADRATAPAAPALDLAAVPGVAEALARRGAGLARFWLQPQHPEPRPGLSGRTALVVDAEDGWTEMLAHQLRHLGLAPHVVPWQDVSAPGAYDLLVCGPGPGDPRDPTDPRIAALRRLLAERRRARLACLAVCLSHQVLADLLGFELRPLPVPHQGVQREVDLFGDLVRVGSYNTYAAHLPASGALPGRPQRPVPHLEVAADPVTGEVHALRGPGLASVQFHAESVLSTTGVEVLAGLVGHALGVGVAGDGPGPGGSRSGG